MSLFSSVSLFSSLGAAWVSRTATLHEVKFEGARVLPGIDYRSPMEDITRSVATRQPPLMRSRINESLIAEKPHG